ncbi:MAG: hypothetical protein QOJ21_3604 [Solirubrobacteraceae bacterium]|jgi:hypothetical protein|nr:hypothetical protein [Solirubrobacteraceae bacterium]
MTSLAIVSLIVVAGVAGAFVDRHAAHPGVEPWPTD